MTSKDFHKSLGTYLDVRRNGPQKGPQRRRKEREPLMRIIFTRYRQVRRKLRIVWKKLKAFFGADHEVDLNSLHQEVFVIERDEPRRTVFWRQFKSLFSFFKLPEFEKKAPTIMKNHLFDKKERMRNEAYNATKRPQKDEEDVDMSKINDIIRNNSLR